MSKNIAIIGDSWSINVHYGHTPGYAPLEYELMSFGHRVFSRGHGGSNNLYELDQFEYFLENTRSIFSIDYVIWFHTELMRDYHFLVEENNIDQHLDILADQTYTRAFDIHKLYPEIKWIIVGGHEPIVRHKHLLSFATVLIEDWRSEILGVKMPYTNFLGHLPYLENNIKKLGVSRIEEELEKRNTIMKYCEECKEFFYDGIHPNSKTFNMLAHRLKKELNL